jgi:hypothetical protein
MQDDEIYLFFYVDFLFCNASLIGGRLDRVPRSGAFRATEVAPTPFK